MEQAIKIGIITAMENELNAILKNKTVSDVFFDEKVKHFPLNENCSVLTTKSGIGKVNAAIRATEFLQKYKLDYLIVAGIGGSVSHDIKVFDTILSDSIRNFDVDLIPFGYKVGQIPGEPKEYVILNVIYPDLKWGNIKCGQIITADSFIGIEDIDKIKELFPKALVADMESAAIAQVANKFSTEFTSIRTVSDLAFREWNVADYEKNENKALTILAKNVDILLQHIYRQISINKMEVDNGEQSSE